MPPRKQQLAVLGPISPISRSISQTSIPISPTSRPISVPISIPISPISSAPHLDLGVGERPARPAQQQQPPCLVRCWAAAVRRSSAKRRAKRRAQRRGPSTEHVLMPLLY